MPDPQPAWIITRRQAIGRQIQHERMRANLTQLQVVELSGVDRITLQRIEAGTTDAKLSWLLKIARVIDIPLSHLVRDEQ